MAGACAEATDERSHLFGDDPGCPEDGVLPRAVQRAGVVLDGGGEDVEKDRSAPRG